MELLQKSKNEKAISQLACFECSHPLCLMVIFMLFLIHSLKNNLYSISAPNRLAAFSLFLYLSLSLFVPSLHSRDFAFCWTILELAIFVLGKIIIHILIVSNTRDISPLNLDPTLQGSRNTIMESLNKFWLIKQ